MPHAGWSSPPCPASCMLTLPTDLAHHVCKASFTRSLLVNDWDKLSGTATGIFTIHTCSYVLVHFHHAPFHSWHSDEYMGPGTVQHGGLSGKGYLCQPPWCSTEEEEYGARILSHSFQPFLERRRLFANKSGLIDVVIQSYENKWCVEKNRDHHHQYSDHHHQYSVVMVMLARDRPPHQTDVTLYIRPSPGNVTAVRLCSG